MKRSKTLSLILWKVYYTRRKKLCSETCKLQCSHLQEWLKWFRVCHSCNARVQFHQHPINTFYRRRSPKCKKYTDDFSTFFTLLGFACVKAVHWTLMKSTQGAYKFDHFLENLHQHDLVCLSLPLSSWYPWLATSIWCWWCLVDTEVSQEALANLS